MEGERNLLEAVVDNNYNSVCDLIKKGVGVNYSVRGDTPLHYAIENGHDDIALLLINSGADINAKNYNEETPLFVAARCNSLLLLRCLLNKPNLNLNIYSNDKTPLHIACEKGHVAIVREFVDNYRAMFWINLRYLQDLPLHIAVNNGFLNVTNILLEKVTSVNAVDREGRTPLWIALLKNHFDIIKYLLCNYRVNPHFKFKGESPVGYAIRERMIEVVKLLIDRGAHLNGKDIDKKTLLHHSVSKSSPELVQLLIDKGADMSAIDNKGYTAFHYAIFHSDLSIIEVFIKNKMPIDSRVFNSSSGYTPLQIAFKEGNYEVAKCLLKHGADINARDPHSHYARIRGGTLLHWACRNYNGEQEVKFLIENGADINAEADDGRTPLCLLIKHCGTIEMIKFFIDNGAKLDTDRGGTPLYWALNMRYYNVARFLIENGLDVNKPIDRFYDEYERRSTPLHIADDLSVVETLINRGANVNALEKDGSSPLHNVRSLSIAKCLVDHGADVFACNFLGNSPLHCAYSVHIAEYLLERGAKINATNLKGYTPLHLAKNIYIAQLLVENGADIHAVSKEGRTVLHSVAESDSFFTETADLIHYFIEKGIDPNRTDTKGNTALKLSALSNNLYAAKNLLNNGATLLLFNVETNGCDLYYLKRLNELFAALKSDIPVNKSLDIIRSHLPLNYREDDSKSTVLHVAAQYGRRDFVNQMLNIKINSRVLVKNSNKINVNAQDVNGRTPLHVASMKNDSVLVDLLLSAGAIYNAVTYSGQTPLDLTENTVIKLMFQQVETAFLAVQHNDIKLLSECVDQEKCVVNSLDLSGRSLLHIACEKRFTDLVAYLLEKGANVSTVDNYRQSVLHLAASASDHSTLITFLKHFIRYYHSSKLQGNKCLQRKTHEFSVFQEFINLKDAKGRTALHIASELGCSEIVQTLTKCGVMFDARDNYNMTPIRYSSDQETTNILSAVEKVFDDAKNGKTDVMKNLTDDPILSSLVTTLTSNRFGDSLIESLVANGYKSISEVIEKSTILKLPDELIEMTCFSQSIDRDSDSDDLGFGLFD